MRKAHNATMNDQSNLPRKPRPRKYTPAEAEAEALRRYEEFKRNPNQPTYPAEEVFARIRQKLNGPK